MADESKRGGPPKAIGATASRALSTMRLSPGEMTRATGTTLEPARLDDAQLARLEAIARAPLAPLEQVDPEHLVQSLAVLDASLPRRRSDFASGRLMLAAYRRKLGAMPREQIDFMCNAILEQCEWFPTIAECLRIAGGWTRADAARKARAIDLIRREDHLRMIEAHRRLRHDPDITQAEVDGWPLHWREAAAAPAMNLLHRDADRLHQIKRRALPPPPATQGEPADDRALD